jgi:hypothetical protein
VSETARREGGSLKRKKKRVKKWRVGSDRLNLKLRKSFSTDPTTGLTEHGRSPLQVSDLEVRAKPLSD